MEGTEPARRGTPGDGLSAREALQVRLTVTGRNMAEIRPQVLRELEALEPGRNWRVELYARQELVRVTPQDDGTQVVSWEVDVEATPWGPPRAAGEA